MAVIEAGRGIIKDNIGILIVRIMDWTHAEARQQADDCLKA